MNGLKRIFVSFKSQIDQVADEFENHEALAGAAIQDLQLIANKTRLHYHRVSKMSVQYQQQLVELQEQARLWSERAIKSKQKDEEIALQCIKRLRQTQKQMVVIEKQCQANTVQEMKIREDLEAIQQQLQVLKNKKELLAARENRASVQGALQGMKGNSVQEVQNVFDRWEGVVVSSEFEQPQNIDVLEDSFSREFEQEEDQVALKKMLDELTSNTASTEDKD